MKTAIYIENGVTQLVLTPECEWEKAVVAKLGEQTDAAQVTISRGSFYECRAGWYRHGEYATDSSLILRVDTGVVG